MRRPRFSGQEAGQRPPELPVRQLRGLRWASADASCCCCCLGCREVAQELLAKLKDGGSQEEEQLGRAHGFEAPSVPAEAVLSTFSLAS